jgi:hypothetical protein
MESLRGPAPVSADKFVANVAAEFSRLDRNQDGFATADEASARFSEIDRQVRPENDEVGPGRPKDSPTARFIGAELRFGDKLIKGAPFSAEIVIEDTRRLFDGSTVTKQLKGLVARDSEGRTRREQPLAPIGGFNVFGSDGNPQKLIFINDFTTQTQYFLDVVRQVAVRETIRSQRPDNEPAMPRNAKSESLGTRLMEGVSVEGTRTSFEIPAGEIGNDKPLTVVTEKWFSPALGVLMMSRHSDPIAGEHVFKLVNLKLAEPSPSLFAVPTGYKIKTPNREARQE